MWALLRRQVHIRYDDAHMPEVALKAFISHAHPDRERAGLLRDALKDIGIECFVAHDDITPSADWQIAILDALRDADIFLPLLTPDFPDSQWTDQEAGVAVANEALIIPLGFGLTPYGFMGRYQALNCPRGIDSAILDRLFGSIISRKPEWQPRLAVGLLARLHTSGNFVQSNQIIGRLQKLGILSTDNLNELCKIWLLNRQVEDANEAKSWIITLIADRSEEIDPETLEAIRAKLA